MLRFVAVAGTSLVVAAPAWGGVGDAPGQLKKQVPIVETPTVSPSAPIATQPTPVPAPKSSAPLEKGKAKGVTRNQTATSEPVADTAPASTAATRGSGATKAHSNSRKKASTAAPAAQVRRAIRHRSRTHARRRSHHQSRTHSAARHVVVTHVRGASTSSSVGAPAATITPWPAGHAHSARATTKHQLVNADAKPAPFTSISQAADRVVEVIPGALVLALAGLGALCLMLMLRSWAIERQRAKALAGSYGVTVEALATAIEAKDHTTGGHIERVRKLGLLLAREIVPREARDPQMEYGFLLHDIGKLKVPDAILRAPGRLDADEWALMRRHPEEGVRMLEHVPFLDKALDVVRHHHERWDGGGYPDGLKGSEIPLWARIFSVVDALDAMTAARPYRGPRSYEEALTEIRYNAGTQFDPDVVAALERIDPAKVQPLLEPSPLVDSPLAPVADLRPLIPA